MAFARTTRILLLSVLVLAGALGLSERSSQAGHAATLNPLLTQWIAAHPGQPVPVIVQVAGPIDEGRTFVTEHGGTIERDLGILNAFSANVSPDVALALSSRDAIGMLALDAPVTSTAFEVEKDKFLTTFQRSTKATDVWNKGMGEGIGIAIVDTGVSSDALCEFATTDGTCGRRLLDGYTGTASPTSDGFGHGTHIANTAAGYAFLTNGQYGGMAPMANIIPVKIDDNRGNSSIGDVVAGLSWVLDNRIRLNIKVVNLSLTSSVQQSYKTDPMDAAIELLTFNGITVVAAAGNSPDAYNYAPANDPFVITVGAVDEHGSNDPNKHTIAPWSSKGVTGDGVAKPDVYAPGVRIVAGISPSSMIATVFPGGITSTDHNEARYGMSGTSMATAVVSGGVALIAQRHPNWTPGQIKQAIKSTGKPLQLAPGARELQVQPSSDLSTVTDASSGIVPSYLLLDAAGTCDTSVVAVADCPIQFERISWGSVNFQKISWSKISWSKISWSRVSWSGGVDLSKISWSRISWGSILQ
jgi:serine protease AprX